MAVLTIARCFSYCGSAFGLTFLWILFISSARGTATEQDVLEVCQDEYFNAGCDFGHVILVKTAEFGRMQVGRCVKGDYGHIGCTRDVMDFVDPLCSGHSQCEFRVYDKLRQHSPCPMDISAYLRTRYTCLKVITKPSAQCEVLKRLKVAEPSGHLASELAETKGLGGTSCPWELRAQPGQQLTISIYNFARNVDTEAGSCFEMAVISEGSDSRSVTTCDGSMRDETIYTSSTNEIKVTFESPKTLKSLGKFILRYEATGCADVKTPYNATSRRDGERLIVRCNHTEQTWYLVCQGNTWRGDLGNCTVELPKAWGIDQIFREDNFPYGILIVVAIGVALGIFCGGLLLTCAAMYMKRRRRQRNAQSVVKLDKTGQYVEVSDAQDLTEGAFLHKHLSNYTDGATVRALREEAMLQCAENNSDKQTTLTYSARPMVAMSNSSVLAHPVHHHHHMGTHPGRSHMYESPRFV